MLNIKRTLQRLKQRHRRRVLFSEMRGILVVRGGDKIARDVATIVLNATLDSDYSEGDAASRAIECGLCVQATIGKSKVAKPVGWQYERST